MNYVKMYEALRKVLEKDETAYFAMSDKTARATDLWSRIYEGKAPWLDNKIQDAGIGAAVAAEIARLVTLELKSKVEGSGKAVYINKYYQTVVANLRIQIEYALAKGGMVFKPYVTDKGISVQYIQADEFFPIEFDAERMTKCAFLDQFRKGDEIYSRVELHEIKEGMLTIRNRVFVARTEGVLGTEVPIGTVEKWSGLAECICFAGMDKLPVGFFCVPLGNNVDPKSPLGVSVFAKAIGRIKEADKRYSQINWEYDSKEAAIHIAQSLLKYRPDLDKLEYPAGKERLYRTVEYSSGAVDKPFIDTFSPEIRDESFFNGWNHQLRLIEFQCNLAYGTLSDPNDTDKTAEEIKASKQRSYSFVKTCQTALQSALEDLVNAISFWCDIYRLCPPGNLQITFEWDDSIVVDKEKDRQTDRGDVAMGAMQLWEYRMKWMGETEEQAKKMVGIQEEVME